MKGKVNEIGDTLMELAELVSEDDCEITADELLENITGRAITVEDAGGIAAYLST